MMDVQVAVPCETPTCGKPGQHFCTLCKGTMTASADHSAGICKDHSGYMVTMQCQKCSVLVCVKCVSNKHKGHAMIGIEVMYEKERAKVEKRLREMEQEGLSSVIQAITKATCKKDEYKRTVAVIKWEMEQELNEIKSEADRIHKQRLKKLETIENTDLNVIDGFESKLRKQKREMEKTIEECKKTLLFSDRQAELIVFSQQSDLNPIVDIHTAIPEAPIFQTVDMKHFYLSDILGKLYKYNLEQISLTKGVVTHTIVSSFRSGLNGFTSLCMTKDGTAWIGGSQSKKLNLVDIDGKIIRSRKTKKRPYCLAITENGDIIMSTNSNTSSGVRRLSVDGTEEIIYKASNCSCRGVSVTRDQEILICTSDTRLMMFDGSCTKEIYRGTGSITHAIEQPHKVVCVSDFKNHQLLKIDRGGCVLKTIACSLGTTEFDPCCVVVDIINNILITDYNNNCVYLINSNDKIIELIGMSHGLSGPVWLSTDKYNNLWVGQEDGSVKIVKYLH